MYNTKIHQLKGKLQKRVYLLIILAFAAGTVLIRMAYSGENVSSAENASGDKAGQQVDTVPDEEVSEDSLQASIAAKILRFHVLANSDSEEDQALKLNVRDAVGAYLEPFLSDADNLSDTEQIVMAHLEDIEEMAESVISTKGYSYPVDAQLEWVEFPEKTYGDYTFPAGEYEALRLVIGEGEGQNWWCVLYPNMCFSGSVYEVSGEEAGEELRRVLTQKEYEEVFSSGELEVRFKLIDIIRDLLNM